MLLNQYYLKELQLAAPVREGIHSPAVKKVQEWLNLWAHKFPHIPQIMIDGDFGPATQAALVAFAKTTGYPVKQPLVVDQSFFNALSNPLKTAFSYTPAAGLSVREAILACAKTHLAAGARETGLNQGPWVRSYMNGQEGVNWPWCVGFVQTVIRQALAFSGKKATDFMPNTFSCDVLGGFAQKQNQLLRNKSLKQDSRTVKPGDLFLISRTASDWTHVGIIEAIGDGVFTTLEGNTNQAGSREGIAVMRRLRNFQANPIDVIRLPELN